jgi:hypothetical protein
MKFKLLLALLALSSVSRGQAISDGFFDAGQRIVNKFLDQGDPRDLKFQFFDQMKKINGLATNLLNLEDITSAESLLVEFSTAPVVTSGVRFNYLKNLRGQLFKCPAEFPSEKTAKTFLENANIGASCIYDRAGDYSIINRDVSAQDNAEIIGQVQLMTSNEVVNQIYDSISKNINTGSVVGKILRNKTRSIKTYIPKRERDELKNRLKNGSIGEIDQAFFESLKIQKFFIQLISFDKKTGFSHYNLHVVIKTSTGPWQACDTDIFHQYIQAEISGYSVFDVGTNPFNCVNLPASDGS